MIDSKIPTVLYINKLSILVVSLFVLVLYQQFSVEQAKPEAYVKDISVSQTQYFKYQKTIDINPFLRSENTTVSDDILPTLTTLQASTPQFLSLGLKLHGIVYQQQSSYAMVSMQGAIQEIYQINDEVSEGLFVTGIEKKYITIDYFGEQHVLTIENTNFSSNSYSRQRNYDALAQLSFNQQLEYLEIDKQRNPIRLFMIRRPYAVYQSGEFKGYKVMPGSNQDQFKRLGFKSGDIITYLNGTEFTGHGMKEYVIEQLTRATHIDLTVLRDGQELSINYGF